MAASMGSSQKATRSRGNAKCPYHFEEVVYVCENCDDLACVNCVTREHKGHDLGSLSDVIPKMKDKLEVYINRLEETELPSLTVKLQKAGTALGTNNERCQQQISEIRKQNDTLKNELDKIAETMVKTCIDTEQQSSDELLKNIRDLQTRIDELTFHIPELKDTLRSGSDVLVFDTSRGIPEVDDFPTPICIPQFISKMPCLQELEQLFGELKIPIQTPPTKSGKWRVTSEFTPYKDHWVKSINATSRDQAWLSFIKTSTNCSVTKMLLVDQSGQIGKTLDVDGWVEDFCLSPVTGNIWYCTQSRNSIREIKENRPIVRFTISSIPRCIYVTKDDHVIVGIDGEAVKYTKGGELVCRSPAIIMPNHISECPLTSNVAVVDLDVTTRAGKGKPSVLILNDKLERLYTYAGQGTEKLTPKRLYFYSIDTCFTAEGELVITDRDKKSVVLVSATGKYLKTLYTDSESRSQAGCVHSGILWVSFINGKVKVLKNNEQF